MHSNSDYFKLGEKLLNEISDGVPRQDLFWKISCFYSDDESHAKRLFSYFTKKYFCASTPVLANIPENGKPIKGLPISCFVSEVCDQDVEKILTETIHLSKAGGGVGTLWTNLPSLYDRGHNERNSFGIIPFAQLQGKAMRLTAGFARKVGSLAVFLNIEHADILNFIRMRKNSQGIDSEFVIPRYIHHAIVVSDNFMQAVVRDEDWFLYDQKGTIVNKLSARDLWLEILNIRIETGEPYLVFKENINKDLAEHHKRLGLEIKTSNLCTEIALITGKDHKNINRTAICCLSSVNLAKYDEWKHVPEFLEDIARFMDNILSFFIAEAPKIKIGQISNYEKQFGMSELFRAKEEKSVEYAFKYNSPMAGAVYSARQSRDVGIGAAGWHTLLQQRGIPFDSEAGEKLNQEVFAFMRQELNLASKKLAHERGACEDAAECGILERFSYKMAIAPNTQIAPIMGVSKGIEVEDPVFLAKNQVGFNLIKNPLLEEYFETKGMNNHNIWLKIASEGLDSVVPKDIYEIFKGPYDTSPLKMIQQAANRPIDQSQSLTLFFHTPVDMNLLIKTHLEAWKSGVKAMYYVRTTEKIMASYSIINEMKEKLENAESLGLKECIMCQ